MRARLLLQSLVAAATAAGTGSVVGCVPTPTSYSREITPSTFNGVTLAVVNRNLDAVRVYVLRGSTAVPVGTVAGMQSRAFRLSSAELGGSRVLHVSVVASPSRARVAMVPVDVEPGRTVEAWIATNLRNSNIRILPNLH